MEDQRSGEPSPSRGCAECPEDARGATPPARRERSAEAGPGAFSPFAFLRNNAPILGAAATALGVVLYVLLTWVAGWVYQPAGVRPSEVGLGYGQLLLGTAVALVAALAGVLAAVAVAFAVVFGAAWLRKKIERVRGGRETQAWVPALVTVVLLALAAASWFFGNGAGSFFILLPAAVSAAYLRPKRAYKVIAIVATILALGAAGIGVQNAASLARNHIHNVTASNAIGVFNNPWEGQIALVQQLGSTKATCGLYLGESNGTGVFVYNEYTEQVKHLRTLRLPLSSVLITIIPDQVTC